ncbi:bifunctional diguanylate cyclase/phosphodiesterase [Sphingobium jiangsuense]|uniref:bifunctional diguanylate cyclase/phosphodiesterase n=1 Tax=Sphingobium jiangsuense TaxID=870476 RepID=UPI00165D3469|nr:EAL domain-containing protein [Sphingobium jiangsuense]GLS99066.1 bifunctional diguanylate cyclase/phosphodiesterase [Sphingobium jiangsuense]
MLPILFCIRDRHDLVLVILAALVCIASAGGAVMLLRQVRRSSGRLRRKWLAIAGTVTGFGIWATHFISILGYDPGLVTGYHPLPTLASLGVAVAMTVLGFTVACARRGRWGAVMGASIVGGGIAAMHYLGMSAIEMPALFRWDSQYVLASILFAIAPLVLALPLAIRGRTVSSGIVAGALLVLAVMLLHFTGMTSLSLIPSRPAADPGLTLSPGIMSVGISAVAFLTLVLSVVAAAISRNATLAIRAKQRQFSILVKGIADYAICMLGPDGRVTSWNEGAARLFGYAPDAARGLPLDAFRELAGGEAQKMLSAALREGSYSGEGWHLRQDGSRFWAHFSIQTVCDDEGRHMGFAKITRDMTRLKEDQDRLEKMRLQLDTAMEHMHQGLCLFDASGHLVLRNRRFLEMWHLAESDVGPGLHVSDVQAMAIRARTHGGEEGMERQLETMRSLMDQARDTPSGSPVVYDFDEDFIVSIATRLLPDGGWVSTFSDITERRQSEARIAHLAMHDGLTGLPNRAHFNERVDTEIELARRTGGRLGVAVLDLDRFKEINDTRGHSVGDEALKMLSSRLRDVLAGDEIVARFGGDEFAAAKAFRNDGEFDDFVRRLASCFDEAGTANDNDYVLAASIGIALYPQDGNCREQILNNADLAMYRAKASIGENICYYEKGMDEVARDRRQIANDLRRALERDELAVLYQPQRSLRTGELTGYEALLRWRHPVRGAVSPADFIPIAEETGEIFAIGEWVLRQACHEAARWPEQCKVAVNISAVQLTQPNLPELVAQILLESGLSPRRLELEITETAIISDKLRALHVLRAIKGMGVSIAIDDFGTGYSSLDTLHSFPFDKIKIDKSFLLQAHERPQARAIIRAVLALGRSLNVPVLAEGVESDVQLTLLEDEGCDEVQGYLFGRPASAPSGRDDGEERAKAQARAQGL